MRLDKSKTVQEVYQNLPEPERITALILRDLILETLPHLREKLSWGAPFYHGKKIVCFVWSASIPWGKMTQGVALGFGQAHLLDHDGFLDVADRKQLGRHVFHAAEEIDVETVQELLRQAGEIDATF